MKETEIVSVNDQFGWGIKSEIFGEESKSSTSPFTGVYRFGDSIESSILWLTGLTVFAKARSCEDA